MCRRMFFENVTGDEHPSARGPPLDASPLEPRRAVLPAPLSRWSGRVGEPAPTTGIRDSISTREVPRSAQEFVVRSASNDRSSSNATTRPVSGSDWSEVTLREGARVRNRELRMSSIRDEHAAAIERAVGSWSRGPPFDAWRPNAWPDGSRGFRIANVGSLIHSRSKSTASSASARRTFAARPVLSNATVARRQEGGWTGEMRASPRLGRGRRSNSDRLARLDRPTFRAEARDVERAEAGVWPDEPPRPDSRSRGRRSEWGSDERAAVDERWTMVQPARRFDPDRERATPWEGRAGEPVGRRGSSNAHGEWR